MATVKDILNFIDTLAPFDTQEEWDNSGLLVGNDNANVTKILFALDATSDVINQAVNIGADLIVTHHPVIFKAVSNVLSDSLIYKLIENKISIICSHTNYDKAIDGVNDILCNKVGLSNVTKLEGACLNIGYVDSSKPLNVDEFAQYVKSQLKGVVRYNSYKDNIHKVAVCSGSGSDYLHLAKELQCDALLTGDGSHHAFLDANEMGIALICAGHFETENIAITPLMNKIEAEFSVPCVSATQKTPINTI